MTATFQNIIQITTLCCLAIMGVGRVIILKFQKTNVLVLDSQMTQTQLFNGIFFIICFFTWIFESFSYGLSLNIHLLWPIFHTIIVQNSVFKIVGIIALTSGLIIYAMALYYLRRSWRIGIDRETPGQLITEGIFRYSRNPIYISLDLLLLGTFLLQGRIIFLLLFACIALSLHYQILQEESFLVETYQNSYLEYCSSVGRYFTVKSLLG